MTTSEGQPAKEEIPLSRGRIASARPSLLVPALAVGGLLVLPAVGLVYAATTTFGADEPDAATSGAAVDEDGEPVPAGAKKGKTARKPITTASSRVRAKGTPRTDEAAECCAALHENAKSAPVEQRGVLLSAAQACESATTPAVAKRRVATQLRSLQITAPEACE